MPTIKIGKRSIAALPDVPTAAVFYDADLKGFGLRLLPRREGSKTREYTWFVEYRPGGGGRGVSKRRMKIGDQSTFDPDRARDEARNLLARVRLGEDPAGDRSEARQSATVRDLLNRYVDDFIAVKREASTARLFRSYIKVHIAESIGSIKVAALTGARIDRLHKKIGEKQKPTANRVLSLIAAAYSYGARKKLLPPKLDNPALGIEKFSEDGRERYLTNDELVRLGETLRLAETDGLPWTPDPRKKIKHAPKAENRRVRLDPYAVAAIRLLLFTGCRLREILHLKWSEVDFETGFLRLSDSKTGKKPVILGAPALALLKDLPRIGVYVIAGAGAGKEDERPRSDLNKPWARVTAHAGLTGLRLHDLRHSFASVGAGTGIGLQIVGRLLGHADAATTQRYAHLADDPLRRASDAISSTISARLDGRKGADVIEIRPKGVA